MASTFQYIAGGLLSQGGKALQQRGLMEREARLAELNHQYRLDEQKQSQDAALNLEGVRAANTLENTRLSGEQGLKLEDVRATNNRENTKLDNDLTSARDDKKYQRDLDIAKAKAAADAEQITDIKQDSSGNFYGITPGGMVKNLGVKGVLPKNSEVPSDGKLSWDDALARAEEEAKDKAGYFSSDQTDFGGSRQDWITRRALELSGTDNPPADAGVDAPTRPATPAPSPDGKPSGEGSKASPYQATSQADISWFKQNARPGDVLMYQGKLYTR